MHTIKHFEFETPEIIGILCDRRVPKGLLQRCNRLLAKQHPHFVCLPFRVEPKYLKNVMACMRLMDICGLIVTGNHVKNIGRFISHFAKAANKSGSINLVARRKKRFIGYLLEQGPSFYAEMVRILTSEK